MPGPEVISDRQDLTGDWDGTLTYPGGQYPTPFRAKFAENQGSFSGSVIEPDAYRPAATLEASCAGVRDARSVDFTKTYVDAPRGYENPVDYVGQLAPDGMTVTGTWSLLDINGRFEMHREMKVEEEEEAETAETVPAPAVR